MHQIAHLNADLKPLLLSTHQQDNVDKIQWHRSFCGETVDVTFVDKVRGTKRLCNFVVRISPSQQQRAPQHANHQTAQNTQEIIGQHTARKFV